MRSRAVSGSTGAYRLTVTPEWSDSPSIVTVPEKVTVLPSSVGEEQVENKIKDERSKIKDKRLKTEQEGENKA